MKHGFRPVVYRLLWGRERVLPRPEGRGDHSEVMRWVHIRDGLEEVIRLLPHSMKGPAATLGELWAFASYQVEQLQEKDSGQCVMTFSNET